MSNTMNRAGDVVAQLVDPDIVCDGQSRKSVPGRTVYTTQSSYTRVTIPPGSHCRRTVIRFPFRGLCLLGDFPPLGDLTKEMQQVGWQI